MSLPPTLISPANVVRVLEVKVIFVLPSDAWMSLPPTLRSPTTVTSVFERVIAVEPAPDWMLLPPTWTLPTTLNLLVDGLNDTPLPTLKVSLFCPAAVSTKVK